MEKDEFEVRIDRVDREDIWKKEAEAWLEKFKAEETPIKQRITEYRINGYGVNQNNEDKIQMNFMFSVTPVDTNNTEWDTPERNVGYIEMTNVDGEYKLDYLDKVPKNYDKFLEEFKVWKKENEKVETVSVQGEKEDLNSNKEIDKISDTIVSVCAIIIVVIVSALVIKFFKKKFPKLKN